MSKHITYNQIKHLIEVIETNYPNLYQPVSIDELNHRLNKSPKLNNLLNVIIDKNILTKMTNVGAKSNQYYYVKDINNLKNKMIEPSRIEPLSYQGLINYIQNRELQI